ncbi:carbon-nitrogen hydrolase family protein [Peptostreptococcus equinus]|uniref:Carbon-nitrogen hydrolase family protein n=1 Tax=Peptostreptococcus equinus TaxID=3003601 RepID=A0ABY7JP63_9FIRM|nr:carbon-nitrogen hydrolase family protein [Peptostreptococcus sp. CBA3647]WAW15163.1 carbon-nitrogen hydrolase family protein [Peptostreptococcus sp. CBA3647]
MNTFRIAVCQLKVGESKEENIKNAVQKIEEASQNGADLVVLPEIFNGPYSTKSFYNYAEEYPGKTSVAMMDVAKRCKIHLVAGSISEKENEKLYNTSYFFNDKGELIGKHRKMHLFDIDIEDGQYFKESDSLTPGEEFSVFDTKFGKVGLGICFDIRFPEYFRLLSNMGSKLIILPAAFNMTTGPAHWEISVRMRAIDNQVYFVGACPARNEDAEYISYANSRISDPWGNIIAKAGNNEEIIYADIDLNKVDSLRKQLPLTSNLRKDLYEVKNKK